jgi:hypothetical protein
MRLHKKFLIFSIVGFALIGAHFLVMLNFWSEFVVKFGSQNLVAFYYFEAIPHHILSKANHFNVHSVLGILLLVLGALQSVDSLRANFKKVHRAIGVGYLICGLLTVVNGIFLTEYSYSPYISRICFSAIGAFWLLYSALALRCLIRGDYTGHGIKMTQGFIIAISLGFSRPFMFVQILFFKEQGIENIFPVSMWLAFSFGLLMAHWYELSELKKPREA